MKYLLYQINIFQIIGIHVKKQKTNKKIKNQKKEKNRITKFEYKKYRNMFYGVSSPRE